MVGGTIATEENTQKASDSNLSNLTKKPYTPCSKPYIYNPKAIVERRRSSEETTSSSDSAKLKRRRNRNEASKRWRYARREREIKVFQEVIVLDEDVRGLESEIQKVEERILYLGGLL